MSQDTVYDLVVLLILLGYIPAYRNVRALDLMVDRLAYIMQQSGTLCQCYIGIKLCCH